MIQYFEDRGIEYHTSGKNVSSGWVEVTCPFPYCEDPSWHLGINLTTKLLNCHVCGAKGPVTRLIRELEGCSEVEANTIVEEFQDKSYTYLEKESEVRSERVILPMEATEEMPSIHREYLQGRGFDPDYLIQKYGIKSCYNVGKWKFRIIIPIYMNGKLVAFTSRLMVEGVENPYKHCENKEAIIPVKECLYNVDSVKDTALIVEGVTDVWKIGDGTIGVFGIEVTQSQVLKTFLLSREGLKRAVLFFDFGAQAQRRAEKFAALLAKYIEVDIVEDTLGKGDPGDLTEKEVQELRLEIFGKEE